MVKKTEDKEFNSLLAEKRHKEVATTLKNIAALLKDDKEIVDAIKGQSSVMKEALKEAFKKLPTPEVKIEMDNKEYASLVDKIMEKVIDKIEQANKKVITTLENKTLVDEFLISQDQWGIVKTVKVVYKQQK